MQVFLWCVADGRNVMKLKVSVVGFSLFEAQPLPFHHFVQTFPLIPWCSSVLRAWCHLLTGRVPDAPPF